MDPKDLEIEKLQSENEELKNQAATLLLKIEFLTAALGLFKQSREVLIPAYVALSGQFAGLSKAASQCTQGLYREVTNAAQGLAIDADRVFALSNLLADAIQSNSTAMGETIDTTNAELARIQESAESLKIIGPSKNAPN